MTEELGRAGLAPFSPLLTLAPALLDALPLLRSAAGPAHDDTLLLDRLARVGRPVRRALDAAARVALHIEGVHVALLLRGAPFSKALEHGKGLPMRIEAQPREREIRRGRRSVRLTRLDQVWWPEHGIRKGDVVAYYEAIAPAMLPHLRDRPFTLKRYPNGPRGPFFWIKDAPESMPAWIPTCPLPAKSRRGGPVEYPLANDPLALLWMVEFGCVDMHLWYSRCDRPAHPDYVLFDLDPAGVGFEQVAEAALLLRDALEALGLAGYVKTTGGEGLHVHVPVARRYTYKQTREFSEIVAGALRRAAPGLITTEPSKERRRGVFLDTKMNGHGMTIACVYSVRPLPGAPVATPVRWDEIEAGLAPAALTMEMVLARVERQGDLFAPLLRGRQRLERALRSV